MLPVVQPAAVTQPTTHTGRLGATAVPEARAAMEASATATAMDFMVSLVQRRVRMLLGSRLERERGVGLWYAGDEVATLYTALAAPPGF